ncbi:hypothetical protein Trydic_g21805 [Trypoxylus dichotomus]
MNKYISKLPVNQMNIPSNQVRLSYNLLTHDQDLSWLLQQTDHAKMNAMDNASLLRNRTFLVPPAKHAFINKRYCVTSRGSTRGSSRGSSRASTRPNIIGKYYNLIEGKASHGTLGGRVLKSSELQNRCYASFVKRITDFFKGGKSAKPVTPVTPVKTKKCGNVRGCAKKANSAKACVKPPPPKIDFETVTKCKTETPKDDLKYMEIICPRNVEVDHKEKPPFASEDGQFLEDRLCKEMPEKRCQKIIEEQALKQEKLQEISEVNIRGRREMKEINTCVKSKKKDRCNITSKTDPCLRTSPCGSLCQDSDVSVKAASIVEKKRSVCNPPKEVVCIPVVEESLSKPHKCHNVKSCKVKKAAVGQVKSCTPVASEDKCANVKPCSTSKPVEAELKPCPAVECLAAAKDPCANIKPCTTGKKDHCANIKPCPAPKPVEEVKEDPSKKCGLIVKPCGSAYKSQEKDRSRSKCTQTKCKNDQSTSCRSTQTKSQPMKTDKPCRSAKSSASGGQTKPECAKVESCKKKVENMETCSELKSKAKRKDDDCKKPPPKSEGDCSSSSPKGSRSGGMSCRSNSSLNNIAKFYSTHQQTPASDNLTATATEQSNSSARAQHSATAITIQPKVFNAYSRVSVKLDEIGIVSINLDVDKSNADRFVPQMLNRKHKFLEPIVDINKPLLIRDNRPSASPNSGLLKLYGLKPSVPQHELGKIPYTPPPLSRPAFKTFGSSPNLMGNTLRAHFSTTPNLWYYTGMPPFEQMDDKRENRSDSPITLKRTMSTSDVPSADQKEAEKQAEDQTKKKPCPAPTPCCKKDKEKCLAPDEQVKQEKRSCKLTKSEEDVDQKKKKRCNFEEALKAEEKYDKKKKVPCASTHLTSKDAVCPPPEQLCCFNKKKCKPKEPERVECPMCKKFEILDIPPKPKAKKVRCRVVRCGTRKPCSSVSKSESTASCRRKSIEKRSSVCTAQTRYKAKEEPPKQVKKERCAQTKCTKKQPKPPCPTPIKAPRLEDMKKEPCARDCVRKPKRVVDEATKKKLEKLCAKPTGRAKKAACTKGKSACDRDKAAEEKAARERQEKDEKDRIYAEMKHMDWRAVPIKGEHRWCKQTTVEKNTKCTAVLSKTVLPASTEKYQSPRYAKTGGKKGPCSSSKKCPMAKNKNVRKMHSCPLLAEAPNYRYVRPSSSHTIPRDYFENMASLIAEKEPNDTIDEERSIVEKDDENHETQDKQGVTRIPSKVIGVTNEYNDPTPIVDAFETLFSGVSYLSLWTLIFQI